ncbi:hypothetical protein HMPREF9318_01851 [Streptococcus urinalis FB127-CNA-2]|uniref:ABC transporter, ATP-binding protein n=1 Tax=Streptococcus urinalis 2285-97 TaxID=764291 RepID=G5KDR6_9STRE|nr:ABC transporter, ATP-binding protein [Streptococcus urinalis 2285-97]EKS17402.1 hypothetical protein HMPREF9318_01851 [Streptococcus urinalis FB127-CNA-2]VEF32775.1 amino acid ABC transporter ATP-binding protein [Streptococcus urinalis]
MIHVKNLSKNINGHIIFQDVNIDISEGELIAITGPSGCGKTTLLNILGLIDDDYTGTYQFENVQNIKSNTHQSQKIIREKINYLFQNFALIDNETVFNNLKLALKYVKLSKSEKRKMITTMLEEVGLAHKID